MGLSLAPVLTRQEINTFHEHSLDLLEKVGIDYKTPLALQVLEKFGCPVDYERTWASLPREVVEWALQQAPRVVKLAARDPDLGDAQSRGNVHDPGDLLIAQNLRVRLEHDAFLWHAVRAPEIALIRD